MKPSNYTIDNRVCIFCEYGVFYAGDHRSGFCRKNCPRDIDPYMFLSEEEYLIEIMCEENEISPIGVCEEFKRSS